MLSSIDGPAYRYLKGESGMEKYEPLEMEVIEFETEDVIVTSEPGETSWAQIGV